MDNKKCASDNSLSKDRYICTVTIKNNKGEKTTKVIALEAFRHSEVVKRIKELYKESLINYKTRNDTNEQLFTRLERDSRLNAQQAFG